MVHVLENCSGVSYRPAIRLSLLNIQTYVLNISILSSVALVPQIPSGDWFHLNAWLRCLALLFSSMSAVCPSCRVQGDVPALGNLSSLLHQWLAPSFLSSLSFSNLFSSLSHPKGIVHTLLIFATVNFNVEFFFIFLFALSWLLDVHLLK